MAKRYVILYLIIIICSNLFSTEIELSEVKEILANNMKKIDMGFISNVQIAPSNENLVSFEARYDDKTVKLFLFNIETNKMFQIESANYAKSKKSKKRYYLKDRGLSWHPTEDWFTFYGNGYNNRDQIFLCKVLVPQLINSFSIKGFRVAIREKKGIGSYYANPSFNSTGDKIFFARKIKKRDKKARYNKTFNIAYIKDVLSKESSKFKDINFEISIEKKFDQLHPVCSPTDPDLVAYISHRNKRKKGEEYYADYSINILNSKTGDITVIDKMDGYKHYPFQWSPSGNYLFYYQALSLLMTEQQLIDDRINLLNLKFAKITKDGNSVRTFVQSNPKTDILLKDVKGMYYGISFINDDNILTSRYDPYNVIGLLDIQKWRDVEKKYVSNLEFSNDSDSPILLGSSLYFMSYEEKSGQLLDVLSLSELKITLTEGQSRSFASSSESATKAQTEEIQAKITKLNTDLDRIEKDISDVQVVLDKENKEFDDLAEQKKTLTKSKDDVIAIRDDYRNKQSSDLENEQKITELITQKTELETNISHEEGIVEVENENITKWQTQIASLEKDKKDVVALITDYTNKLSEQATAGKAITGLNSKIKNAKAEITKIDKSIAQLNTEISAEETVKSSLEKSLNTKNTDKAKFLGAIDNLKIEKAKTMEAEGMLASFQSQLDELNTKSGNIDLEIKTLQSELTKENTNLTKNNETLTSKTNEKSDLLSSIDKLKDDKIASLSKDKESKLLALQTKLDKFKIDLERTNDKLETFVALVTDKNKSLEADRASKKTKSEEKLALTKEIEKLKSSKTKAKQDDALAKKKKEEDDTLAKKKAEEEQARKDKEAADLAAKKKAEEEQARKDKEAAANLAAKKKAEEEQARKDKEAADLAAKLKKEAEELAKAEKDKVDEYEDEDEYADEDDEYSDEDDEYSDDEEDYFDNNTTTPTSRTGSTRRRR